MKLGDISHAVLRVLELRVAVDSTEDVLELN